MTDYRDQLITDVDARYYFSKEVRTALSHQQLAVHDETAIYITNLLVNFLRSEQLYEETEEGVMIKPLVFLYRDAVEATSQKERMQALQRLGDISLFISGLFAQSLSRSLVDVDYYIAMGGNAYSHLADTNARAYGMVIMKEVYTELAMKFTELVDVLAKVGENSSITNDHDILRLYEIWLSSGSRHAVEKLQSLGIQPVRTHRLKH